MIRKLLVILSILFIGLVLLIISNSIGTTETNAPLADNQSVYNNNLDVKEVYITIMPANTQPPEYAHTFTELNEKIYEDINVKVLFQEGENGAPRVGNYGYGLTDANGVMSIRGQSTRRLSQKSYKIELNKKAGLWNGVEVVNLNKHMHDPVKVRNKLNYDLFRDVPNFTSLETQFVHLYIKDYSEGDYQQEFVDYGLFTQLENIDKDYLKNHGLDSDGWLYKAEYFEFYRYPDNLKLESDSGYSEELFEEILDIKGNRDHSKLISMLEDVNNPYIHINQVIDKHFDRDNYVTWLAVNLLVGNIDTTSRNFFLYSPTDNNHWYFIPWDYDGTLGWYDKNTEKNFISSWQKGVSNYWGVVLHRRFLENDKNREELTSKIEELSEIITSEKIMAQLKLYEPEITDFLTNPPDNRYSADSPEEIQAEFERISKAVEINKQNYYLSLEKPMPVFMGEPINSGGHLSFSWESSYDFQGDNIEYGIAISTTPTFDNVIYHKDGIKDTEHIVDRLEPGSYFWRLEIKDSDGNVQVPFDKYMDETGIYYHGVKKFIIN